MGLIINDRIPAKEVRLVDQDGTQIGVVPKFKALEQARQVGLDLVMVTESTPPVCKILNANKYQYEMKKKEKEAAKKQRESAIDVREIQLHPVTAEHDISIKVRKAKEFLEEGDRVKVIMKFRGREISHKETGIAVLQSFLDQLGEVKLDRPITDVGRDVFILVSKGVKNG